MINCYESLKNITLTFTNEPTLKKEAIKEITQLFKTCNERFYYFLYFIVYGLFINQENNNGFLIEKDDIDGFANSLKILLEDDILHETFANGAKKSSDEVFSLSASLEKTYEIYTSLLKN